MPQRGGICGETKRRTAFVLREIEGMDTEAICKILEVTRTNLEYFYIGSAIACGNVLRRRGRLLGPARSVRLHWHESQRTNHTALSPRAIGPSTRSAEPCRGHDAGVPELRSAFRMCAMAAMCNRRRASLLHRNDKQHLTVAALHHPTAHNTRRRVTPYRNLSLVGGVPWG